MQKIFGGNAIMPLAMLPNKSLQHCQEQMIRAIIFEHLDGLKNLQVVHFQQCVIQEQTTVASKIIQGKNLETSKTSKMTPLFMSKSNQKCYAGSKAIYKCPDKCLEQVETRNYEEN